MSPWTDLKSTGVGCMANLTDINHCFGNCRSSDICFRDCNEPSFVGDLNTLILLSEAFISALVFDLLKRHLSYKI